MKKLRDAPLRYHVAALVYGGISLFLFGVVFALLRQADRIAPNPAWAWVLAALIASIAAVGVFFALVAWGALSDPKSRLGSWFREYSVDGLFSLCADALIQGGFLLILWIGSYSISIGAAAFLCWVLLLVRFFRPGLKSDIEALNDPNDNPRANRLVGKSGEPRSYDYRD